MSSDLDIWGTDRLFKQDEAHLVRLHAKLPYSHSMAALGEYAKEALKWLNSKAGKHEIYGNTPEEWEVTHCAINKIIYWERNEYGDRCLKPWIARAQLETVRFAAEQALEDMHGTLVGYTTAILGRARVDYQSGMAKILAATGREQTDE